MALQGVEHGCSVEKGLDGIQVVQYADMWVAGVVCTQLLLKSCAGVTTAGLTTRQQHTGVVADFVQDEVKWPLLLQWLREVDGFDEDTGFTGEAEELGVQVLGRL